MYSRISYVLLLAFGLVSQVTSLKPPVFLPTPPMGFNDWAKFFCGLNETLFVDTAEAMLSMGLQKAGYNRLNLDDCWPLHDRAANGSLQWDPEKFPHGLPWLANYLNSRGFSLGIYSDAGNKTCGGFPGSLGFEEIDAKTFQSWGIDYLKLDGCNMPNPNESTYKDVYGKWHTVLDNLPEPLIFSESAPAYFAGVDNLTDWYHVMDWVPKYGNLARHSQDVLVFNSTLYWPDITGWDSIMANYGQEIRLARHQKPGYFNDPDFLNVDHANYTMDEKRSHFALWSSLSAPLIISAYIPAFTPDDIAYLTNADIIAIDQDPLGLQATLVSSDPIWDVLTKDLAGGDRLLTVLNKGNFSASLTVPFSRVGIVANPGVKFRVKDLWTGNLTHVSDSITATNVPSHGTAIFRISPLNKAIESLPTGMLFNTFTMDCLTASGNSSATWAVCNSGDGQVWQVTEEGSVKSLLSPVLCLTDAGRASNGSISMTACSPGTLTQKWTYTRGGNLINRGSGWCLTEAVNGTGLAASGSECGFLTNEQVLALPGGVELA